MELKLDIGKPKTYLCSILRGDSGISIAINGHTVALFEHNGDFCFWGDELTPQFNGSWRPYAFEGVDLHDEPEAKEMLKEMNKGKELK